MLLNCRFIPTCVGFTNRSSRSTSSPPVHPHMRGVYAPDVPQALVRVGSSPHAWGLRIPISAPYAPPSVHPHMRGVYGCRFRPIFSPRGSSPHAWGLRPLWVVMVRLSRFIPTCVGFTPGCCCIRSGAPVHPHMRGVYTKERLEFW